MSRVLDEVALFSFALSAMACSAPSSSMLEVSLAHESPAEQRTREQLSRIARQYDLSRWIRTHVIRIDENAIPHSHPVLTLHTRHLDDDDLLLSTFLHEQMHWHLDEKRDATLAAVAELRQRFPVLPVGFPDGARDAQSSYEHLLVNHLEHTALRAIRGPVVAQRVFEFWTTDHYRALYRIELNHETDIARIVEREGLTLL
jgi:hypothetical protein